MAEQEELAPLRSLHSDEPTFIVFINKSGCPATAWWLNFLGSPVSYGEIRAGHHLKMNTFLTHPWIFRSSDGSRLLADLREIYLPTPAEYGEDGQPLFLPVTISAPVCSLQECCSKLIRKLVRKEDVSKLEIPEFLRKDIRRTPDLLQDIKKLKAQRLGS